MLDKVFALELIKILSSVETWSFAKREVVFPDHLYEKIDAAVAKLSEEILK